MLSCPYFVQKTYILSKSQCSSVISFHYPIPNIFLCLFFKKHSTLMPIHYQKNDNSLKNTILSCHFFLFLQQQKNHHTSGIELVFSFDYPSKMTKNLIVQSVQNSVYPQTPCCAFRYATISPQCYVLCGPLIAKTICFKGLIKRK